ncbi:hypothetical protein N7539_006553 [Penicillium diatomitis]|uniref:Nephrocystin 3-like N-terminal domain-containing protein n=1 Tax=Penicillium diatomitis TaxID=2819901 RepID=A0A9W9X1I7_9EURO|nr:uncharacterized protein N7539_006553 [Penicillium diatomitis]KAJ5480659.1 hypothetical protein N7539_006553 [Penicillium diatomitis]
MATGPVVRGHLTRISRTIRTLVRCIGGNRENIENNTRALLLLCELQDLCCRLQDQLIYAEDKWITDSARLLSLSEVLASLDSTVELLDRYFQPGGVTARLFRKRLLETTFVPRLEEFKTMLLLTMQPRSSEKNHVENKLRIKFRQYHELDSDSISATTPKCGDYKQVTDMATGKMNSKLADLCTHRQNGSCQWIFDEDKYDGWLFGNHRTLYCVGPAGAGKTFLASTVIENVQKVFTSAEVAVVYFLGHDETEETSTIAFLETILAQLVSRKNQPSHTTLTLYESEPFQNGHASAKGLQDAIRAEVNRFSRVFFVIDDIECLAEADRVLSRLQKLPDHCQFLVTTRESRIDTKDPCLSVHATRQDLELYVTARLEEDQGLHNVLKRYPIDLKIAIVQQVVKKSHGLFLLARFHIDLLSRCTDGSLLQRALFHLPESLNDAYGEIMTRIVSENTYASRCLFWTLYSRRPLTVAELSFAASFEPLLQKMPKSSHHSEQDPLAEAAGLLRIDELTQTIQLVHQTAKEYLGGPAARVFFPTAKKHIAETCLTLITSDEVVDECYMTRGMPNGASQIPLLNYAITHWGDHAREISEDEQTTQVLIRAFLNKLCWRRPPIDSNYVTAVDIPKRLGLGSYFIDWSGLHVLAYFGILSKARRLIEQGVDIDENDNELGITPLHCAVHRGHEQMLDLLIEHNADLDARSRDGDTALHIAASQGHRKLIKSLLNRKVNSRIANSQGATALHLAIGKCFDEAIVPLMVRSRFDLDFQNTSTGNTALHLAVEMRRPRILSFLIEKGANMNMLNREGVTPLQLACQIDNCEAISLLLERHAHLETRSSSGDTALHFAAQKGHWIAFELLLSGGADINAWNSEGNSLLHDLAHRGAATSLSMASHLLEGGANIEACNSQGHTVLQRAALSGNKAMFFHLLDRGADVGVETAKGETLLHIIAPSKKEHLDIIAAALELGLSPNAMTCSGFTPIHSVIARHLEIIQVPLENVILFISLMISHGANIDAQLLSHKSATALHLAIACKSPQELLVAFLIKSGAALDLKTSDGHTPVQLAVECGSRRILALLLEAGADSILQTPALPLGARKFSLLQHARESLVVIQPETAIPIYTYQKTAKHLPSLSRKRDSIGTEIDELEHGSDTDEIGGSTLVGEDASVWGSRSSTTSMDFPTITS